MLDWGRGGGGQNGAGEWQGEWEPDWVTGRVEPDGGRDQIGGKGAEGVGGQIGGRGARARLGAGAAGPDLGEQWGSGGRLGAGEVGLDWAQGWQGPNWGQGEIVDVGRAWCTVWHETTLMSHQSGILHSLIFLFILVFDYYICNPIYCRTVPYPVLLSTTHFPG